MVAGAARVFSKKARCTSCTMTGTPSAAKARRPPVWSKWLWLAMTYRIGLPGTRRRVSAITASARSSLSGPSATSTWSRISMTTL